MPCNGLNAAFSFVTNSTGLTTFTTNSILPTGSTINWNFGNGATQTGSNPVSYTYTSSGSYGVWLNLGGACSTSYYQIVPINISTSTSCNATFTYTTNSNGTINFQSTGSNASNSNYSWNFGNGTSSNSSSPITNPITFTNGTYTVCLLVQDTINNCSDSSCQTITITNNTNCNSTFTATPNPSSSTITLTAIGNNLPTTNYNWSLGNGTSGYGQNYTATYNAAGTYLICLIVHDTINNCSDSSCQTVTLNPPPPPTTCSGMPTVGIVVATTTSPVYGGTVVFGMNGASTGNGIIYQWQRASSSAGPFYDIVGAVNDSYFETINSPYCYRSYVTCTNSGLSDTSNSICITPVPLLPCNSSFTITNNGNNYYTFTSTGNNNGPINLWWTINNNFSGSGMNYSHYFTSNGSYTVCLIALDTIYNCYDTTCQIITVTNIVPTCTAAFNYISNNNGTVSLFSTGSSSNTMTYTWLLNNTIIGTGDNFTYSNTAGIYNICLATYDSAINCYDTICHAVTVPIYNLPCNANYYILPDTNGAPHTYIGFNNSTGQGITYTWIWGDGTTSTGQYPSHTYASAGNYIITLIIDNGVGCTDTFIASQTINKTATMYTINFANPTNVKNVSTEIATISPNPATNSFVIKGNADEKYKIEVMNMNGSKIKTMSANANQTIDISTLANTIYLLKITDQNGQTQFSKLIKE